MQKAVGVGSYGLQPTSLHGAFLVYLYLGTVNPGLGFRVEALRMDISLLAAIPQITIRAVCATLVFAKELNDCLSLGS